MRWSLVLGLLALLAVSGAACVGVDPTPPQQAPISDSGINLVESVAAIALPATPTPEAPPRPTIQTRQIVSRPDDTASTAEVLKRPNILFILTDDLDTDSIKFMPQVNSLLMDAGASFSNHLINVPFCCPSRASILRGQYAHNTQIISNWPPLGGSKNSMPWVLKTLQLPLAARCGLPYSANRQVS